jgi:hypothetical protein
MRRSLQKFESLTKALSKIKGAPKVVNLADDRGAQPKSTKLPKIHPAASSSATENSMNDSEVFKQLTLLDHLLRLPADQLRASSQRVAVSHAGLIQPIAQPERSSSAGVSLFSSAASLGNQTATSSLQQPAGSSNSPSRNVSFAAADAGLVTVHVIPTVEKVHVDDAQQPVSKPAPAKVSPRARALKASFASGPASSAALDLRSIDGCGRQGTQGEVKPVKTVGALLEAKIAYAGVRSVPKARLAHQVAGADDKRKSA